jgi:hypothetical protein
MVRVEALFLHERILPQVMERLVLEFRNWANLENPVIVDKNNIVLDGNHRTCVFKRLGFKYIPVCRIDYFENDTKLRYWFRLIGVINIILYCLGIPKTEIDKYLKPKSL